MSEPVSGPAPLPGETVWYDMAKLYTWNDEPSGPTYCEIVAYYSNNTATRCTLQNTSTLHTGIMVVRDKTDAIIFQQAVAAPHPLQTWDLSGYHVNINTDKFQIGLGMKG